MSPTPSIPIPRPPGKDPPPPHSQPTSPKTSQPDPFPALSPSPTTTPTPPLRSPKSHDSKTISPPPLQPKMSKPRITTQGASTSNLLQTSRGPSLSAENLKSDELEAQKPRPNFSPFFTLINDLTSGEPSTHHPSRIHYLFADDDESELLSAACIRSLESTTSPSVSASRESLPQSINEARNSSSSSSSATFKDEKSKKHEEREKEKGKAKREERVIIVDVNDSGDGITSINCLSEKWQILSAELSSAPTWDNPASDPTASMTQQEEKGLMLRIEGLGISTEKEGVGLGVGTGAAEGKKEGMGQGEGSGMGEIGDEEMQVLLEGFDRKMGVLRKIVGQQQMQGKRESWGQEKGEGEV